MGRAHQESIEGVVKFEIELSVGAGFGAGVAPCVSGAIVGTYPGEFLDPRLDEGPVEGEVAEAPFLDAMTVEAGRMPVQWTRRWWPPRCLRRVCRVAWVRSGSWSGPRRDWCNAKRATANSGVVRMRVFMRLGFLEKRIRGGGAKLQRLIEGLPAGFGRSGLPLRGRC